MICTAANLISEARCYLGMPRSMLWAMRASLLCEWFNASQTPSTCEHPLVDDWLARMEADSVALPSDDTIKAVCEFCHDLDRYGLTSKLKVVNPVIPDSIAAMKYPLIWQPSNGVSPFINYGFTDADLTKDGLKGDGESKYMDTGLVPDTQFGPINTSSGMTVYITDTGNLNASPHFHIGAAEEGHLYANSSFSISDSNEELIAGNGRMDAFVESGLGLITTGFHSGSRTAFDLLSYYHGTGSSVLSLTNTNTSSGIPPEDYTKLPGDPVTVALFALDFYDGVDYSLAYYSSARISFMAIHDGLTQPETANLFAAVQKLRMALGGGYV